MVANLLLDIRLPQGNKGIRQISKPGILPPVSSLMSGTPGLSDSVEAADSTFIVDPQGTVL